MATNNDSILREEIKNISDPTPEDHENEAILEALSGSADAVDFSELSNEIESSGEKGPVETLENFQFSALALDKILSKEAYAQERAALFAELARKNRLDLDGDGINTEAQFASIVSSMTNISKKEFKEIAPAVYDNLYAELESTISLDKSKKMLKDAGINVPEGRAFDNVYEANRIAYAFHQNFGDSNVSYEQKLKESAPEINKGFKSLVTGKAVKFGILAVMTCTTGGSNLVVKAGLAGVKRAMNSEALGNVFSKGADSFKSFLNSKGVDTKPFDDAMSKAKNGSDKIHEKLKGSRIGRGVLKTGALVGVGIIAMAFNDFDFEAVQNIVNDSGPEVANDTVPKSGTFGQQWDKGTAHVTPAGDAPDTAPAPAPAATPTPDTPTGNSASPAQSTSGAPETQNAKQPVNMAHGAEIEAASEIADVNSDYVINEPTAGEVTFTLEAGSNPYAEVKSILTEANGMPPSEAKIMQVTGDMMREYDITDPSKIPAGTEFTFNPDDYQYVTSISQDTVDMARFGVDGIPDGLKGQTLGEIASGKFEGGSGPVDTKLTGYMMSQEAVNAGVQTDIQKAIEKGLDPDMKFSAYIAGLESKVAELDVVAPVVAEAKTGLVHHFSNVNLEASNPDNHPAPTTHTGAPDHYNEIMNKDRTGFDGPGGM